MAHPVGDPSTQLTPNPTTQGDSTVVAAGKTLAISSWRAVLSEIRSGLNVAGDTSSLSNVDQLVGLCDQMDTSAFVPLTSGELTSTVGRRIVQFGVLMDDVANRAVDRGIARTAGTKAAGGNGYDVRPLYLEGRFCVLSCSCHAWGSVSSDPIALMLSSEKDRRSPPVLALAQSLPEPFEPYERSGRWEVGLPLPIGVERSQVLDALYDHLSTVATSIRAFGLAHPLSAAVAQAITEPDLDLEDDINAEV
jgi:hypothetical protein